MKRRWFALILILLCTAWLAPAQAQTILALDEIGLRYTPTEGEICVTRQNMDASALLALGTDNVTLTNVMARDGIYLISLFPDGHQISLMVSDKPAELTVGDASELTTEQKATFLSVLARNGSYANATWVGDGYALFSATVESQGQSTLQYSDISLQTLYLDQIYTFQMDLIGREAQQSDTDLLLAVSDRALRLGATAQDTQEDTSLSQAQTLTLPKLTVQSQPATLNFQQQDIALTLDTVADTIGMTQFTLSGVTEPGASLKYSVNGKTSSRIKADDQGIFSVTVPNLDGNAQNAIGLSATAGEDKTIVAFTVTVDWITSPLALETVTTTQADEVTLQGLTLPGSTVKLTQGRGSSRITVGDDGTFSVKLATSREGANEFTLQVQSTGYRRNDYDFTITRELGQADVTAQRLSQARTVDYQKLLVNTSTYADTVVLVSGVAESLDYLDGTPCFTLNTTAGETYMVLCTDLLNVQQGETVNVLGTLTGELNNTIAAPALTLLALLP